MASAAVLLAVLPFDSPAQIWSPSQELGPVYLDVDSTASIHLQRADASLADGQWAEGIDVLEQVMQTHGDKLVELTDGRYVNVRTLCHLKIAALPGEALLEYRRRVDGQAASWYEQAARERSDALLHRVVRQYFCSSAGDDALWLLGEMALEQGRFWQARSYWERILPPDSTHWNIPHEAPKPGTPLDRVLTYPDTSLDVGEIRARLVLCLILAGDRADAERELAELARDHPDAAGFLAGAQGRYTETLRGLLEQSQSWPPQRGAPDWPTFAGNVQRNKSLPFTAELGAKIGTVELQSVRRVSQRRIRFPQPRIAEDLLQPLSYFPVLHDGKLLVNNGGRLLVLDPSTCQPLWESSDQGGRPQSTSTVSVRQTLTVYGNRAYAMTNLPMSGSMSRAQMRRFGGRGFARRFPAPSGQNQLVCWSLDKEGEELWNIQPPEPDLVFEAAPVVHQGRFYVALRREGPSTQAFVACYDDARIQKVAGAPDKVPDPQLRWLRFVCQASPPSTDSGRPSHNLLTLAGNHVYFCTNLGAIGALDSRDGTVEWVFTYDRHSPRRLRDVPDHFARDLNPCLIHQGTVVAAPADTPEIFALDAATGRKQWASELLPDAVHLLGVGEGNLIASGRGLYFVDMTNGKVMRRFLHVDEPPARGYGRGILSGGRVYWPTREEIWVFDQASGLPVRRLWLKPHGETGGNLLLADGYLIIAQSTQLVVFAQYSRLFEKYEQAVAEQPENGALHYRLGRAAEATKRWDLAERSYRTAAQLAQQGDTVEAAPLTTQAHERLYGLLSKRAAAAAEAGDWLKAVKYDQQTIDLSVAAPLRLEALLRSADRWLHAGRADEAVHVYQRVLADDELATTPVTLAEQLTVPARRTVRRKLAEVIQQYGREVYADYDTQVQEALGAAVAQADVGAARELLDRYPAAAQLREALSAMAERLERQGRPRDAAQLYRKLTNLAESDSQRAALIEALARAYAADGFRPESLSNHRVADRPGDPVQPAVFHAPTDLEDLVPAEPAVRLPLLRSWQRGLPDSATVLEPEGLPPTAQPRWLYLAVPGRLACWSLADGTLQWQTKPTDTVTWLGYAGDTLLIGTAADVTSVNLADGQWNWRRHLQSNGWTNSGPTRSDAGGRRFLLAARRLYCHAANRLVALDPWTGATLWSTESSGEEQLIDVMPDDTLLAYRPSENALLRLDTSDGSVAARVSVPQGAKPPLFLPSGRVCIVLDRETIELYDLSEGRRLWRLQEESGMGWPDVFGDGRHLLLVFLGRQELLRLDPESGSELWRCRVQDRRSAAWRSVSSPQPLHSLAFADEETFYYAANGTLKAVALEDGHVLWQQYLGTVKGQWRVRPAQAYLVAHSVDAEPASADAELDSSVVFCDRRSGRPVERWNFEGAPSVDTLVLGAQGAAVAAQQRLWSFRTREFPPGDDPARP